MKRMTLCMLFFIFLIGEVEAYVAQKKVTRTVASGGVRELVVDNKYGHINVSQSGGNQIEIEGVIMVQAKDQLKAEKLVEYIAIEVNTMHDVVKVLSSFGKDMSLRQMVSSVVVDVNYTIKVPQGVRLRLINTKGDINVGPYQGAVNIDMLYGNIKIDKCTGGELYIKHETGKCNIASAQEFSGIFRNSNLTIIQANSARLTLKESDVQFEKIGALEINSDGGRVFIERVRSLYGSTSNTEVVVREVENDIDLAMKWGSISVGGINPLFQKLKVDASYAEVVFDFPSNAGYNLNMVYDKFVDFDMPPYIQINGIPTARKNTFTFSTFVGNQQYKGNVDLNLVRSELYIE